MSSVPNASEIHGPFITLLLMFMKRFHDEKVVNYRRQFFNVFDDVCNHCGNNNWHHISSGSKAEGLDLPGSDFDVMLINKDINVYERVDVLSNYHDLKTKLNLVLDFDCYLLMILVASHRNAVYQPTALL
jgi:hypothetical protein